jgi:PAS domain S-box-containing protein
MHHYSESIVETVREPLVVLDEKLRVKKANRAFYQTFSVTTGETEGTTLFSLGNGQWDIPALRNLLEHILPENTTFEDFEVENEFPLIGRRVMLLNARRIFRDEEGATEILLAIEDITVRKQAEENLKKFAARLEHSNRELQEFASVASHDLQEPLRKIQAFGDLLKTQCQDALPPEGHDYLERMQSAAVRMQTLINDLLMFARVETTASPFVKVDLEQVAREVASDLETRIEREGARVEIGELPVVEADPTQMRQLLQNLIENALKYRRKGVRPVVKIHATVIKERRAQKRPGNHPTSDFSQIMVEDNGIGFDEKYLDRIFLVFQRLHGRKEYEGTGIGLAVCRKIAERHNGSITAKSTPGRGSSFIVTLPLRRAREED